MVVTLGCLVCTHNPSCLRPCTPRATPAQHFPVLLSLPNAPAKLHLHPKQASPFHICTSDLCLLPAKHLNVSTSILTFSLQSSHPYLPSNPAHLLQSLIMLPQSTTSNTPRSLAATLTTRNLHAIIGERDKETRLKAIAELWVLHPIPYPTSIYLETD
jgi:hypothetical protein